MREATAWFDRHAVGAPARLVGRARQHVEAVASDEGPAIDGVLARAGQRALDRAIAAGAGREAALDLLAADALITLALLRTAVAEPGLLGARARALRDAIADGAAG